MEKDRERDEADTCQTDTYEARRERKKVKSSDPRDPPDDYEELLKMVTTFAGVLWVYFGDKSDFYKCLCFVHDILKDKSVQARKHNYTVLICRMVTWAIIEDSRYFFNQTLMPADFAQAGPKNFPNSLLYHDLTDIHYARPLVRPKFPVKWAFDGLTQRKFRHQTISLFMFAVFELACM